MKTFYLLAFSFCFFSGFGQTLNKGSQILSTEPGIFGYPQNITENWEVELVNKTASDHVYSISKEEILKQKNFLNELRAHNDSSQKSFSRSDEKAFVKQTFEGNQSGNNVPPDNTIAISKNGYIVSGINSNIIFANTAGNINFSRNLSDFFTLLDIGSSVYDSRAIYDHEQNRFIFMALHGNTPANTKIVIAFSKQEDPSAGWYYYSIKGNPLGDNRWFDYPNVGITKNDLFISGLMRNDAGDWQYTILFQIDKNKCFKGEGTNFKYYADVKNPDGEKAFNLVAAQSAWSSNPDKKMYFVSNVAQGGDKYFLHSVDGIVDSNPSLTSTETTGLKTALAPDGLQPSGTDMLNTFDSRIWNAMELNGTIHFGGHVNSPQNTSGILYGRYDIANNKVYADVYYDAQFDYGFPSIAAFGKEASSDKILINFLKSGKTYSASQGNIICEGKNEVFNWGKEVETKKGSGSVNALQGSRERWGDYSTICRRFADDNNIEVWTTGCHAKGTSYGTWLTQLFEDTTSTYIDFIAESTTIDKGQNTIFKITSPETYSSVTWTFEAGNTSDLIIPSPSVKYQDYGIFDVSLSLIDSEGKSHTITKKDYITVQAPIISPVTDFIANRDTIFQGEYVQFMDKSINDAVKFTWTFQSGTPAQSSEKNPLIQYLKKGSFLVGLTSKNIAGQGSKVKQKFITVKEVAAIKANFAANKNVVSTNEAISFSDQSINFPISWKWSFPGGTPSTSTDKNPVVTYTKPGPYDVSLVVKNASSTDSITKKEFIVVSLVNTTDKDWIENVQLFPNPIPQGEKISVNFNLKQSIIANLKIVDNSGRIIKHLLDQRIKAGENLFSFSPHNLNAGQYYLSIESEKGKKSIKFIIQ